MIKRLFNVIKAAWLLLRIGWQRPSLLTAIFNQIFYISWGGHPPPRFKEATNGTNPLVQSLR